MQQKLILFYHFALSVIKSSLLKFCENLTKIFYVLNKKKTAIFQAVKLSILISIIQFQTLPAPTDPVLRPHRKIQDR